LPEAEKTADSDKIYSSTYITTIFTAQKTEIMTLQTSLKILLLTAVTLTAVACGGATSDPAPIVEQYITAKASSDETTIRALICSEMEANISMEALTFDGIEGVEIEDMSCQQRNGSEVVACSGRITALYGSEISEFPLENYRVVQEDGDWKWCGEAE